MLELRPLQTNRKCYVSGPISSIGLEEAKIRFDRAEKNLQDHGWETVNPLMVEPICGFSQRNEQFGCLQWGVAEGPLLHTYDCYLRSDLVEMLKFCDTICMLEGWSESPGATLEYKLAIAMKFRLLWADMDGGIIGDHG